MKILFKLYAELLPILALIPAGYFLKKKFNIKPEYVSTPLIKFLLPILVFFNMLDAEAEKLYILPIFTLILAFGMAQVARLAQKRLASDFDPLLLSASFSFFNIAFFGIPTVSALFGDDKVSTLICVYLGSALYGDTIGYFQVAKTKFDTTEAFKQVMKIPFLYVFVAGIIAKFAGMKTPDAIEGGLKFISLSVSCAGMLIVGFQLAAVEIKEIKIVYYLKLIGVRTVAAMLIMAILIFLEYSLVNSLQQDDYKMLLLVSVFPVATNVTVFASFLDAEQQKPALIVAISALISLVLVSVGALLIV
ncbi:AEC family transporter [Dyadobacter subterraneus]|uniref:Transporter n=1 Tax=Dyadobacter subterraneus TaxID=2773304 RepID=A0ABR9WEK8_9BACT|nr:hypothetical protein [Dyadobacter subterraneus]MBE9463862.1 hypothetical protein [Dyadobacter subterraneus]